MKVLLKGVSLSDNGYCYSTHQSDKMHTTQRYGWHADRLEEQGSIQNIHDGYLSDTISMSQLCILVYQPVG